MTEFSKNNEEGKTELLDMDDDALIVVLNNCTLRELITLRKTCKKFYALISDLPRYKKGIKELEELYTSGILKITEDEEFLITLFEKNYSNFVLGAIDFRFHRITSLAFWDNRMLRNKEVIHNKILIFISHWCKMLTSLWFCETKVTDVSCLVNCKNLKRLFLQYCNGLTDVSGLDQCNSLYWLYLTGCAGLKDISCLGQCKMLRELYLKECTGLRNVSGLEQSNTLRELYLDDCTGLKDISCLGQCKELSRLSLDSCTGVTDVSSLGKCKWLRTLFLNECTGLTDVSCLCQCKNLTYINLEGCTGVTDVSELIECKNILAIKSELACKDIVLINLGG